MAIGGIPPNRQAPTPVPANLAGALSEFADGDVISARVQQSLANGVRLAIGRTLLDVATQVPLKPGTTVRLVVNRSQSETTLRLLPEDTGARQSPSQPARPSSAAQVPGQTAAAQALGNRTLPAQAVPPQSTAHSAPVQAGASGPPTEAGGQLATQSPAAPKAAPAARSAAAQTPAAGPAPGGSTTAGPTQAQGLESRQISSSIAELPAAGSSAGDSSRAGAQPVRGSAPPASANSAPAAGGQPGIAPPFATAARTIAAPQGGEPGPAAGTPPNPEQGVAAAGTRLPAQAPGGGAGEQPQATGAGRANAATASPGPAATGATGAYPVKAGPVEPGFGKAASVQPAAAETVALARAQSLVQQGSLAPLFANLAAVLSDPARVRLDRPTEAAARHLLGLRLPADSLADPARLQAGLRAGGTFLEAALGKDGIAQGDLKSALLTLRTALQDALGGNDKAQSLRSEPPPPPERHASPSPQRPAAPSLPGSAGSEEVMRQLAADTQGALARVRLLQIASLPDLDAGPRPDGAGDAQPRVWQMEVPVAAGRETTVLAVRVEEDRRKRTGEREGPVWRVRFAIDLPEAGAISAAITYTAPRISVALWAEREETSRVLAAEASTLGDALRAAELDVEAVDVETGTGPAALRAQKPGSPGRYIDREG